MILVDLLIKFADEVKGVGRQLHQSVEQCSMKTSMPSVLQDLFIRYREMYFHDSLNHIC